MVIVHDAYKTIPFPENGMEFLRKCFPSGRADPLNFCIFSTSGTHGSYRTLEEVERQLRFKKKFPASQREGLDNKLTVLICRPRLVHFMYGDIEITLEDVPWLKLLRSTSKQAVLEWFP